MIRRWFGLLFQTDAVGIFRLDCLKNMRPSNFHDDTCVHLTRPRNTDGASLALAPCFLSECCQHCGANVQALMHFLCFLRLFNRPNQKHVYIYIYIFERSTVYMFSVLFRLQEVAAVAFKPGAGGFYIL